MMDEDMVNMEIRKFLKKVGVTSQREIENALQQAIGSGRLKGDEKLTATMTLKIGELSLVHTVSGEIVLE
jgi:hypothetical protein